jgi:uncharacterized protein YdhG (YjbR/CyaY superfamily)
VDEYLAALPPRQRAALRKIRAAIRAAAPRAEECVSYRLPAFREGGKVLVAFGAAANHCALYPMSGETIASLASALKEYDTSKGTIRFSPDSPLSAILVKRLVSARRAENATTNRTLSKQRTRTPKGRRD